MSCGNRISRDGRLAGGYRQTSNFHHHMKWEQEVVDETTHSGFASNRLAHRFAADFDIVGVEGIEDFQTFLHAGDVSAQDCGVQYPLSVLTTLDRSWLRFIHDQSQPTMAEYPKPFRMY